MTVHHDIKCSQPVRMGGRGEGASVYMWMGLCVYHLYHFNLQEASGVTLRDV